MACTECGRDLRPATGTGRPRRYCSRSCQSRAYRRRRDQGRLPPGVPTARLAVETPGDGDLVSVAIALADDAGAAVVTLRAVAHRAGVPLAQVRRAFGSRDRLVAAVVQRVLGSWRPVAPRKRTESHAEARAHTESRAEGENQGEPLVQEQAQAPAQGEIPAQPDTPHAVLAQLAEQEWAAYREHPWLVAVLASSRPPLVPAVLNAARASTEAFEALGADPPSAMGRYLALSGYVQGMALLLLAEHDESARSATDYRAWWAAEVRRLDRTGARRAIPGSTS